MRLAFNPYLHSRKLMDRLRFVEVPTLITWGEKDRLLSVDHAKEWQARIPRAELSIVEGAGHFPHVERQDACLDVLTE